LIQWKAVHKPSGDKFIGLSIVVAETRDKAEDMAVEQATKQYQFEVVWKSSMTFDDKPGMKYQDFTYTGN